MKLVSLKCDANLSLSISQIDLCGSQQERGVCCVQKKKLPWSIYPQALTHYNRRDLSYGVHKSVLFMAESGTIKCYIIVGPREAASITTILAF